MTVRRIFAVIGIFLLACGGWAALGTTTLVRSNQLSSLLGARVGTLWGGPVVQRAPAVALRPVAKSSGVLMPGDHNAASEVLMPSGNRITTRLVLDYRKKGLIWYPTFVTFFEGSYALTNPDALPRQARFQFLFPSADATYDNVAVKLDGELVDVPLNIRDGVVQLVELDPGATREVTVAYQTRGLGEWRYQPDGVAGRVRNLAMTVHTNFHAIDFPDGALSPMAIEANDEGMTLSWNAQNLLTTQEIAVAMPERLNPGPLSGRITFFAPICMFFFFLLLMTISVIRKISVHPMHYLFVAGGFFAFHLLFAYGVDHIDLHVAFGISALTSVGLVTAYLRRALGPRFPWTVAAFGQVFYLVLFSYSFFFVGMTGLTVTLGAVATLAMLMKVTAGIDWNAVFARPPRPANAES